MAIEEKTPLYQEETEAFLGYIVRDTVSWQAQTVFGYVIAHTMSREDAENALQAQGLDYLQGVWQYYDVDEHEWFPCVIKKAHEHQVVVDRTNALGFEDPEYFKHVIIDDPSENNLIKSA